MAACDKCSFDYFQVIAEFYNNDAKSLVFFRPHSVLPSEIICPHSIKFKIGTTFTYNAITVKVDRKDKKQHSCECGRTSKNFPTFLPYL